MAFFNSSPVYQFSDLKTHDNYHSEIYQQHDWAVVHQALTIIHLTYLQTCFPFLKHFYFLAENAKHHKGPMPTSYVKDKAARMVTFSKRKTTLLKRVICTCNYCCAVLFNSGHIRAR